MFSKMEDRVIVRITADMHLAILEQAQALGVSISSMLRIMFAYWLEETKKQEDLHPDTAQIPGKEVP